MHHVNLLTETGEELSVYADNVKGRIWKQAAVLQK
jgi:hypothetical protein